MSKKKKQWIARARIHEHCCVACGYSMDAVAAMVDFEPTGPVLPGPGDSTICARCLTVNVFQQDGSLRAATSQECEQLPEWAKEGIAEAYRERQKPS